MPRYAGRVLPGQVTEPTLPALAWAQDKGGRRPGTAAATSSTPSATWSKRHLLARDVR
jgi:hypothetical protein